MIPHLLQAQIVDLLHRLEELERRVENRSRKGKILEVDPAQGLARVELDKDPKTNEPVKTAWIPWKEAAMGAIKTHFPPEVGEQVVVNSESGDMTDAIIDYSLPSNTNQRPHDKIREGVITLGDTRIHFTGEVVNITSPRINLNPG